MAKKTIVLMTDDIDGSEASETVAFGLDGNQYEIDLSGPNALKMRNVLAQYIECARTAPKTVQARTGRRKEVKPSTLEKERNRAIREWAAGQRIPVSDRGRISADVIKAYDEANPVLPAL